MKHYFNRRDIVWLPCRVMWLSIHWADQRVDPVINHCPDPHCRFWVRSCGPINGRETETVEQGFGQSLGPSLPCVLALNYCFALWGWPISKIIILEPIFLGLGTCQLRCNLGWTWKPKVSRTWWTAFVGLNVKLQIAFKWPSASVASWSLLSRKDVTKPACLEKIACGQSLRTSMSAQGWQTRTIWMRTRSKQSTTLSVVLALTLAYWFSWGSKIIFFSSVEGTPQARAEFRRGCQQLSLTKKWMY